MRFLSLPFIFGVFILCLTNAHAAGQNYILFIDLNNAPGEIDAAEAAALKNGETLVVIPGDDEGPSALPIRTPEEKAILKKISPLELSEEDLAEAEKVSADPKAAHQRNLPKYAALEAQKAVLETQLKDTAFGSYKKTTAEIKAQINAALNSGKTFTSLIISGEHFGSVYYGTESSLNDGDLSEVIAENPKAIQSIRSVYGMGCYTATVDMEWWWRARLPKLEFLAGYDPRGARRDFDADHAYLQNTMNTEKGLVNAIDAHADQQALDKIIRGIIGFSSTNAAVCTCGLCVSEKFGDTALNSTQDNCSQTAFQQQLASGYSSFVSMLDPSYSPDKVPCDVGDSWLRTYFSSTRHQAYCATVDDSYLGFTSANQIADRVGLMVFFQSVVTNFAKYNAADLSKLSKLASKYGFPMLDLNTPMACESLKTQNQTSDVDRGKLLQWIQSLQTIGKAGTPSGPPMDPPIDPKDAQFIRTMQARMSQQLTNLNCVPAEWTGVDLGDEAVSPPPKCCLLEDMKKPECGKSEEKVILKSD